MILLVNGEPRESMGYLLCKVYYIVYYYFVVMIMMMMIEIIIPISQRVTSEEPFHALHSNSEVTWNLRAGVKAPALPPLV